jgi:mersacidin/lichenicidin family type 2 lantibiotic
MDPKDVIRAWKDPEFRSSLDTEAQSTLPTHPSGLMNLDDADLMNVSGGTSVATMIVSCFGSCDNTLFDGTCDLWSLGCCDS